MKILLGVGSMLAFSFFGILISERYKKRVAFLEDFGDFLLYLTTEVGYFRKRLNEVVDRYAGNHTGEFCSFLQKKGRTSSEEEKEIEAFLKTLNETDANSQSDYIKINREKNEEKIKQAQKKYGENGVLAKKLCPLFGVAVFLLFL